MESIEILAVVESVSNEKGIEEGIIFGALETAIASASSAAIFMKMQTYLFLLIELQESIQLIDIG